MAKRGRKPKDLNQIKEPKASKSDMDFMNEFMGDNINPDDITFMEHKVREVDLNQNPNAGYTPQETAFIEAGMKKKSQDFVLITESDRFLAWRSVICELKIKQLEIIKMNLPAKQWESTQRQIEMLDKQYKSFLDSLNVLKKQRDNSKDRPDTDSENWFMAIESVDKLKMEARKQEQAILNEMKKRDKRNKS